MKHLQVFDPAMCCSTGVCARSVDSKLVKLAPTWPSSSRRSPRGAVQPRPPTRGVQPTRWSSRKWDQEPNISLSSWSTGLCEPRASTPPAKNSRRGSSSTRALAATVTWECARLRAALNPSGLPRVPRRRASPAEPAPS
ncbi:MAG: arsenic metallochaperone ArsD family protein [Chthonomonadaceae bacterium]|nr:arsenic metallochaperone ArsD family protein [Chthonomonadaceae bacterium]